MERVQVGAPDIEWWGDIAGEFYFIVGILPTLLCANIQDLLKLVILGANLSRPIENAILCANLG